MALPFFYKEDISQTDSMIVLDEDTSKHVVQVLRMENGENIKLTDGNGNIFTCQITDNHRKKCVVAILETSGIQNLPAGRQSPKSKICIAVSPLKNSSRFEWFLEKATEIGVTEIVPIICDRTEKPQLKPERLKGILVSAMLQSQQAWLPVLQPATRFTDYIKQSDAGVQKFIAHCEEDKKTLLADFSFSGDTVILIGPEGDFTSKEIEVAIKAGFEPVSLGETRLRTETAALAAAVLLSK